MKNLSIALTTLFALTGLITQLGCPDPVDDTAALGEACTADADCESATCAESVCAQASSTCKSDGDCGSGACEDSGEHLYECSKSGPGGTCAEDGDCLSGNCVDGECHHADSECESDDDCESGTCEDSGDYLFECTEGGEDPCDEDPTIDRCDGTEVQWCSDTGYQAVDCAPSLCIEISADYGHDCAEAPGDVCVDENGAYWCSGTEPGCVDTPNGAFCEENTGGCTVDDESTCVDGRYVWSCDEGQPALLDCNAYGGACVAGTGCNLLPVGSYCDDETYLCADNLECDAELYECVAAGTDGGVTDGGQDAGTTADDAGTATDGGVTDGGADAGTDGGAGQDAG